jgi:hypothetical protein
MCSMAQATLVPLNKQRVRAQPYGGALWPIVSSLYPKGSLKSIDQCCRVLNFKRNIRSQLFIYL